MEQLFKLKPVVQGLKLSKYLQFLTNQIQSPINRLESLKPGEEVGFQLQAGKIGILSFVGQKPEKISVDGNTNKLRVMMPDQDCILTFRSDEDQREVEVAYSILDK
jgi:hypothetical protein